MERRRPKKPVTGLNSVALLVLPERLAEDVRFAELTRLPTVVGGVDCDWVLLAVLLDVSVIILTEATPAAVATERVIIL